MVKKTPVPQPDAHQAFLHVVGARGEYGNLVSPQWYRWFTNIAEQVQVIIETSNEDLSNKADKSITLTAGTGLDGGGDLSADRVFDIADTGVSVGTYGDGTNVPQFTVNSQGQLVAAANVSISFPPSDVTSVFGRAGDVVAVSGDYDADQIDYDNTISGLSATNAQNAIDEVYATITVTTVFGRTGNVVAVSGDYDADQVDYDNSVSGLSATEVQAAIDELAAAPSSGIDIEDNSTPVATATTLNFINATVTDAGGGQVDVDVGGGGGGITDAEVMARVSLGI